MWRDQQLLTVSEGRREGGVYVREWCVSFMCVCVGGRSVCVISLSSFGCFHMNSCFPSSPLLTQPPSARHTLQ